MKGVKRRSLAVALIAAAAVAGAPGRAPADDNAARVAPIVVTATRIEQKASEQASSVSVVTREVIEMTDPAVAGDVLRGIPGVDVQRAGSVGNRENIKLRGGAATHTLVMIDGFPLNSPTLGSFDISTLPVDGFERVEIVRGAQSALYGSNAMGGVVNFIPRSGREGSEAGARFSAGSHQAALGGASVQAGGPGRQLFLDATGFRSDGILPNDDTSLVSFLGSGETRLWRRLRLHALVLSTDGDKGIPIDFGSPRDANHRSERRGFLSGARLEADVAEGLTLELQGMLFDEWFHEKDPLDPGETGPFVYAFDDLTKTRKLDARLMAKYAPAAWSTTFVGAEYERDRATDVLLSSFGDNTPLFPSPELAASTFNRSVFVQEELRPGKGVGISLGARLDRNSAAGTEFNPKAAVFYEFSGGGPRIRAAAGRGFRVPTISEEMDPLIGNRSLSAEVVRSYEAGTDVPLAGDRLSLSGTFFYQQFSNLIQFDMAATDNTHPFGQLVNRGHAFSRGVEAQGSVRPIPEVEGTVSYTFTDTWDGAGKRILGIPRHRGMLSLLVTPVPALRARIDWLIESDQLDAPPNGGDPRRPGYARVDAHARYRWELQGKDFREVALTGKVENLLDRKYEERRGFPAPGFGFLLGAELKI